MAFNQTYHRVERVYNVEGTLILSDRSDGADLAAQLANIRQELARQPDIPEPDRQRIETELNAAETEAAAPKPAGAQIKTHLDRAATTLESAAGAADKAGRLAKTLFDIGKWALTILA